jgi:DNA-directed RNA polymerase specialized sigma24 family protein
VSTADELDALLYAWLSEPEVQRAELLFSKYFQAASPAICRFVRAFHTDAGTAQDIAQQALIKLFTHLGTERGAADARVREAVSELRPLDFGPLHERRVDSWRGQVTSFRDAAVGFRLPAAVSAIDGSWKDLREAINRRIPPLTQQGAHFLEEVRKRLEMNFAEVAAPVLITDNAHSEVAALEREEPQEGEFLEPVVRRFVENLLHGALIRDSAQIEREPGCSGVRNFVTHTNTVCTSLPALAIPSNGLLYTVAKRQLLDQLRARRPERAIQLQQLADGGNEEILGELEPEGLPPPGNSSNEGAVWSEAGQIEALAEPDAEVEARYKSFLAYLRAPLTRAEAALEAAAARGPSKVQRSRVESLRAKYERLLAVLSALRESPQPTEEDIARRLGLSRNQVKYVIERVREDFNYFFPDLARKAQGRRKRQGSET